MNTDRKTNVLSTLSSFNTLLSDFPTLLTVNIVDDDSSAGATISFLLDIAGLFGMTQTYLLKWLSNMLTDDEDNPVRKGILTSIEAAIKSAIALYLTSLYTCSVDPLIPDEFLRSTFTSATEGNGIKVPVTSIDAFHLFRNCPTTDNGSIFYFDISRDSVKNALYRSTDMNAWLWWVINNDRDNWYNYTWDNRVFYRAAFKDEENGDKNRKNFVDVFAKSQSYYIKNVGVKKSILTARYQETGPVPQETNVLYVYGSAETYKGTGFMGRNKTVFDFNADYIASLKLFDSKTLTAQVINSVVGLATSLFGTISLEFNILIKKIEKTVEKIVTLPAETAVDDYFSFSEAEYADIVNDATLRYNGKYQTNNETNDVISLNTENIVNAIKIIDSAVTADEKEAAIINALNSLGSETENFSFGINTPFTQSYDIIQKFLKEIIIQISLQVLSPKVMLLFAINDYFLNNETNIVNIDFNNFLKNFWNIISTCIRKISDLIMQSLFDLVLGFIRPILLLVVKKLILETLFYYKQLLLDLITKCLPNITINLRRGNYIIDNVNYADIIATETQPTNAND